MIKASTPSWLAAMTLAVILSGAPSARAESLGDLLREHRWHLIIGTWVDEDTRGGTIKVTYAWKFKDQLIQVTFQINHFHRYHFPSRH